MSERRLPPDITGDELYRRLQQDPKTARIPFLFLSASVFAGRPADASVAPLAFKPLLPDQLVSLLRSMGVVAR